MNEVEDRFEAAARALAEKFPDHGVPPLRLPAPSDRPARWAARSRLWRRSRGWLIPLAAAVAVVAAVIAPLALIRHPGGTSPSAPAATGPDGTPPYYLAASTAGGSGPVILVSPSRVLIMSTSTNQVLARVSSPAHYRAFTEVANVAGNGAFVLGASPYLPGGPGWPGKLFLLRFDPVSRTTRLTPLPVTLGSGGFCALALSPDASRLAVAMSPACSGPVPAGQLAVTVYNLATGGHRTWTGRTRGLPASVYLSWSGNGPVLGIGWVQPGASRSSFGRLDTAAPGTRLPARGLLLPRSARPELLAPDGRLIVINSGGGISEYSPAGRPIPAPSFRIPAHQAISGVLATNATATALIVQLAGDRPATSFGLISDGPYRRLMAGYTPAAFPAATTTGAPLASAQARPAASARATPVTGPQTTPASLPAATPVTARP